MCVISIKYVKDSIIFIKYLNKKKQLILYDLLHRYNFVMNV